MTKTGFLDADILSSMLFTKHGCALCKMQAGQTSTTCMGNHWTLHCLRFWTINIHVWITVQSRIFLSEILHINLVQLRLVTVQVLTT
jgi:hypothetical protein